MTIINEAKNCRMLDKLTESEDDGTLGLLGGRVVRRGGVGSGITGHSLWRYTLVMAFWGSLACLWHGPGTVKIVGSC